MSKDPSVPGCTLKLHLPVVSMTFMVQDTLLIFKPRAGETACMIFAKTVGLR